MSKFMVDLVGPNIRLTFGSASNNGWPRGLVALAMAAVSVLHCAAKSVISDVLAIL